MAAGICESSPETSIFLRAHPRESAALFHSRHKPSHEQKVVSRQPVEMHMLECELVVVIEDNGHVVTVLVAVGDHAAKAWEERGSVDDIATGGAALMRPEFSRRDDMSATDVSLHDVQFKQ
jgi:hypothetical protein